jgi:dTDP-glucose pyrophosphorylase
MNRIKIGVIPAAGAAKRMGYLGQILPKCLFPVYDKPVIHHVLENMSKVGVEQVYVIVNHHRDKVMEYLQKVQPEIGVGIEFINQVRLSGIADAIMLTSKFIKEPFMVTLGDDCTLTQSMDSIVHSLFEHNAIVVEGVVREDNKDILKSTCCLELDHDRRIVRIVEKPEEPFSNLRGCGIYVFQSEIFKYIEKTPLSPLRRESEITQTIALVAKDGKAYAEFINGVNININSCEDLLQASLLAKRFKLGLIEDLAMKVRL